jgi:hypothetical protein
MATKKTSTTRKVTVQKTQTNSEGAPDMVDQIATSLLDKNKDGEYKDDLFRMAWEFIKKKFFPPKV